MQVPQICKYQCSNYGQPCNETLLKCVELLDSKVILYPIKVYCYMPLRYYLNVLLKRPGFHEYWKFEGKPFVSDPFTYSIMLNIDWFKPCKHAEYSVGAIYLTASVYAIE